MPGHGLALGLALTAAGQLGGCGPDPAASETGLRQSLLRPAEGGPLVGSENGLELRKWLVADVPDRIAVALSRRSRPGAVGADSAERLRRNGFRLVRLDLAEVAGLLDDLGGASINVSGWHGQIFRWRSLLEVPLSGRGTPVAVDGRIGRYAGGAMQLLARSWTLQMEDGPVLHLELVPAWGRPGEQGGLSRLLGGGAAPERFESMRVETELEAGSAYLLTCASPDVDLGDGSGGADAPRGPGPGPDAGFGPDVATPLTLGQLMLSTRGGGISAGRAMLLFVPRVPAELFPAASADG